MKTKLFFFLLFLIAGQSIYAQNGTLTFYANGFKNQNGKAVILLFRENDKLPQKPFKTVVVDIKEPTTALTLNDLPFGNYAALLLHDVNNNGIIDHSWGFPSESLGYTNDWELTLFSGLPTFSKLKFTFSTNALTQNIHISYHK
jgi:uncharacterized protein (DUF2141 family)